MNRHDDSWNEDIKISPRIRFEDLRNLLASIGSHLSELLASRRIGIYLQGRESGNWALAVTRELNEFVEEKARIINHEKSPALKTALENRQMCLLEEILEPEVAEKIKEENLIIVPMHCENEIMGLLLADFDSFASLAGQHLLQLQLAATVIKTAIEKELLSIQIDQLKQKLANSTVQGDDKYLQDEHLIRWLLDREIDRSKRHGSTFALLAIRLDNLAHVISQYGQPAGLRAVEECHEAMRRLIRKCDLFIQSGSDTFVCLSAGQNTAGSHVLAERLRHRVKETTCLIDNFRITMTVSIGITIWPDGKHIDSKELLNRSFETLKTAHSHGNRVRLWRSDQST
ncbi:GGDEF domain-containing protein [bacterium]|nr:GGDEF domain-containing protein [candidate division CSSED10-310 bacterium]